MKKQTYTNEGKIFKLFNWSILYIINCMALTGVITCDALACYNPPPPPPCGVCEVRTESGGCIDRDCGDCGSCCYAIDDCVPKFPSGCFECNGGDYQRTYDIDEQFACRWSPCYSQCEPCKKVCEHCTGTSNGCEPITLTEIVGPSCNEGYAPYSTYTVPDYVSSVPIHWYLDGELKCSGTNLCWISFETCGPHTVTVQYGEPGQCTDSGASKDMQVEVCDNSTTTVSYNTGLDSVVSGIESGIDSIPRVTASGWSASASFSATKGEECCDLTESKVDYYTVSGSVDVSGSVSVDVPGLSWSWNQTYGSLGKIDASLGISIVPSITVDSASVSASGTVTDPDCGSCLTLSGGGDGTGTLTCTAGGVVTLTAFPESDWLNYELNVNISAQAQASVTAWANGVYNKGDASGCEPTGFCLLCYGADPVQVTGTVTFEVGPWEYSATSDPVTIIEGCHIHPEC